MLYAFYISFHEFSFMVPKNSKFIFLDNYINLFSDDTFLTALKNTAFYSLGVVPVQMAIAFLLAVCVNSDIKGKTFFRVAFFLPTVTSSVAVSLMFMWMYSKTGIVNYLFSFFGIPAVDWLNNIHFALPALMALAVWTTVGNFMIIYLAGLQEIPKSVYEAADLDGLNAWQRLRFITWPLLKNTTYFVLIMSTIGTFQVFDTFYIITKGDGGPLDSTMTVVLYIFKAAFKHFDMGYASAMAFMLFLVIFGLSIAQRLFFGREEEA
ncbi:MAG: sugar ABC transporter permease [Elusimicrobia bacterium]|nr:MAG: sugar ABC transporter permease [Elusimicrobiota bacterium]